MANEKRAFGEEYTYIATSASAHNELDGNTPNPHHMLRQEAWHLPSPRTWSGARAMPDVAVLEVDPTTPFVGIPLKVANVLPTPNNIAQFAGKEVTIVGYSDHGATIPVMRRAGRATITGVVHVEKQAPDGSGYFSDYAVANVGMDTGKGDSGGPVLLNGELVGVHRASGSVSFIAPALIQAADADSDGVPTTDDNCPSTPNASQANCDDLSEWPAEGDACDQDPCLYLEGVSSIGNSAGFSNVQLRVHYRGVGYSASGPSLNRDIDAFYCACHKVDPLVNPKDPQYWSDTLCQEWTCKHDGVLPQSSDLLRDAGWTRMPWVALAPDGLYSLGTPTQCSLTDTDSMSPPEPNDCPEVVPQRLFRRPYHDRPELATVPWGWEQYWKTGSLPRTRNFKWDWRTGDFPHHETVSYRSPYTGEARVRLWIRPANRPEPGLTTAPPNYSGVVRVKMGNPPPPSFDVLHRPGVLERLGLLGPLTEFRPDPQVPEPNPGGPLVLHALRHHRSDPELQPYLWASPPPDNAIGGLVVLTYQPRGGRFNGYFRSEAVVGNPPYTNRFAATAADDGSIYLFGGQTRSGVLVSGLWHGRPLLQGEEIVFQWSEVQTARQPPGRADGILVFDKERERLLLMFGRTTAGPTNEVHALDLTNMEWSTLNTHFKNVPAVSAPAHGVVGNRLYVYGGHDGGSTIDGLYAIDLSILDGWRVDGGTGGPGQRSGAGLGADGSSQMVYVFGGWDGERKRDLWAFSLGLGQWYLLSDGVGPGAPQAMDGASVLVSPIDGAVSVLAGRAELGATEPVWRLRGDQWQSFSDMWDPEQW